MAKLNASPTFLVVLLAVYYVPVSEGWCNYVDLMLTPDQVDKVAILGHDGKPWTGPECADKVLNVSRAEFSAIYGARGDDNPVDLQKNGVTVEGVTYMYLSSSSRVIRASLRTERIHIVFTGQTVIVAHMPAGGIPEKIATIVEKMADYLISVGY